MYLLVFCVEFGVQQLLVEAFLDMVRIFGGVGPGANVFAVFGHINISTILIYRAPLLHSGRGEMDVCAH